MDILNGKTLMQVMFLFACRKMHTIGKGLLIAEIQQTSDITYRIYDFTVLMIKATNASCIPKEAVAAIDYNFYPDYKTNISPKRMKLSSW